MAHVQVQKDLTKIKSKVLFGLTKRQLICFGGGVLVGFPLFFLLKPMAGVSVASIVMIVAMLPFFLLGMYEKNSQPLEVILYDALQTFIIKPKQRPYQTDNFYEILARQDALEREVYNIVHKTNVHKGNRKKEKAVAKAHQSRKKADHRRH